MKDRAAKGIVDDAERSGRLAPGGTIVEGTAGNTGIALALIANARGYRSIICVPDDQSEQKYELLRTFGSELHIVPAVPFANPENYYHVAQRIAAAMPGALWADQFNNLANRRAHYENHGTRRSGTRSAAPANTHRVRRCALRSTGRHACGARPHVLEERNPARSRTVLCDPEGSSLYCYVKDGTLDAPGESNAEGIGIKRITKNFEGAAVDDAQRVTDRAMVEMAYWLLREEGLFVGGSAALNVVGAARVAASLPEGSTVVTILCDGGERYRSRMWNRGWLEENDLVPRATGLSFL